MGNLSYLPIRQYRVDYGLTTFIETGAGGGTGIDTGIRAGFEELYSCEYDHSRFIKVNEKYQNDKRVGILEGLSTKLLPHLLNLCSSSRVLFWLDAHLPPIEEGLSSQDIIPLENELRTIVRERDVSRDVIIIDDLILFDRKLQPEGYSIEKHTSTDISKLITREEIEKLFPDHISEIVNYSESYLILFPKTKEL